MRPKQNCNPCQAKRCLLQIIVLTLAKEENLKVIYFWLSICMPVFLNGRQIKAGKFGSN
jgi:hypothetical protein